MKVALARGTKGPHLLVGIGVILCEADWAIDSAVI